MSAYVGSSKKLKDRKERRLRDGAAGAAGRGVSRARAGLRGGAGGVAWRGVSRARAGLRGGAGGVASGVMGHLKGCRKDLSLGCARGWASQHPPSRAESGPALSRCRA